MRENNKDQQRIGYIPSKKRPYLIAWVKIRLNFAMLMSPPKSCLFISTHPCSAAVSSFRWNTGWCIDCNLRLSCVQAPMLPFALMSAGMRMSCMYDCSAQACLSSQTCHSHSGSVSSVCSCGPRHQFDVRVTATSLYCVLFGHLHRVGGLWFCI